MAGNVRSVEQLDQALRRLEDRVAITELAFRYAIAVDDRDFDALGTLYASDAVFDTPGGRNVGRDAVVGFYRGRLPDFGATVHTPHGHVITFVGDDEATGIVTSHAELAIDGEAFVTAFRYDDRYVREDGEWRFAERNVSSVYAMYLRDLPTGLGESDRARWPGRPVSATELPETLQTYLDSLRPSGGGDTVEGP
jgi:hypothetical protein